MAVISARNLFIRVSFNNFSSSPTSYLTCVSMTALLHFFNSSVSIPATLLATESTIVVIFVSSPVFRQ